MGRATDLGASATVGQGFALGLKRKKLSENLVSCPVLASETQAVKHVLSEKLESSSRKKLNGLKGKTSR